MTTEQNRATAYNISGTIHGLKINAEKKTGRAYMHFTAKNGKRRQIVLTINAHNFDKIVEVLKNKSVNLFGHFGKKTAEGQTFYPHCEQHKAAIAA